MCVSCKCQGKRFWLVRGMGIPPAIISRKSGSLKLLGGRFICMPLMTVRAIPSSVVGFTRVIQTVLLDARLVSGAPDFVNGDDQV